MQFLKFKIFSQVVFIFFPFWVFPQIGGINSPLQNIIPTTPTASELGKYGSVPVGMFTGTPTVTIPIYHIETKNISIPINLSYSSNGVIIDKFSSNVGIDWSLNAGGIIIRQQFDDPDECRVDFPPPPYDVSNTELNFLLNADCVDFQPDIFSYNVGGESGKFYLDDNFNPIQIDPNPIKIQKFNPNNNTEDPVFLITNAQGIKFWFGGLGFEDRSGSMSVKIGSHTPPSDYSTTAWYLSKIEDYNGNYITFEYEKNNYTRYVGFYQSAVAKHIEDINSNGVFYWEKARIEPAIYTRNLGEEVFIKQITWDNGKINFLYNSDNKVQTINILNQQNNIIQKYQLNYETYFGNSEYKNLDDVPYSGDLYEKRIFLKSIHRKEVNDNSSLYKYTLDYYEPQQLPPRFSYARDHWGYFNGYKNNSLLSNDLSNYSAMDYNSPVSEIFYPNIIKQLFYDIGGNKNANSNYALYGLLKNITYPTGVSNEFIYEGHSVQDERYISGLQEKSFSLNVYGTVDNPRDLKSKLFTASNLPLNDGYNFIAKINAGAWFNDNTCDPSEIDELHQRAVIRIFSLNSNQYVDLYSIAHNGTIINNGKSYTVTINTPSPNLYISPDSNNTNSEFRAEIYSTFQCTGGGLHLTYRYAESEPYYEKYNKQVGGMRIKTVKINEGNGIEYTDDYKYGNLECLDCSSGKTVLTKPAISFFKNENSDPTVPISETCTLGSSTLNSLYFAQSYHIGYPTVIKIKNNSNKDGYRVYRYNVVFDQPPILVKNDWIPGTPYTNGFGSGELQSESFLDSNQVVVESTKYFYKFNSNFDKEIVGHNASYSQKHTIYNYFGPIDGTLPTEFAWYNVNSYQLQTKRRYLSSSINTKYDQNGNAVTTTTTYNYNGVNPLLLSSQTIINSKNENRIAQYIYPQDLGITGLTNFNRIADPVESTEYTNNKDVQKISKSFSNFNGIPQISKVEVTKSGQTYTAYELTNYDPFGNIQEAKDRLGRPTVYLWAYNSSRPIAKIENATLAQVNAVYNSALLSSEFNKATIASRINTYRTQLPNSRVTGFIYDPSTLQLTEIIDPNGVKTKYEYDDFQRLKQVLNDDEFVLNKYLYHYRNQ